MTLNTRWSMFWRAGNSLPRPGVRFTAHASSAQGPTKPKGAKEGSQVPLGGRPSPREDRPPPPALATHLEVGFGHLQGAGVTQLVPQQAEGADAAAMLAAEELEELVVLRTLALLQVTQGRTELVVAEGRAVPVGPQVLGAEGCGAGQAGLHGRGLLAAVAQDGGCVFLISHHLLLGFGFSFGPGAALELLHHPAQHRVLLQLRAAREGGAALRAAEVPRQPGPGELQAGGAEVVPAGNGHGAAEQAEADGAGQFLLQPRHPRLGQLPGQRCHGPAAPCPESKLGAGLSGNQRGGAAPPGGAAAAGPPGGVFGASAAPRPTRTAPSFRGSPAGTGRAAPAGRSYST